MISTIFTRPSGLRRPAKGRAKRVTRLAAAGERRSRAADGRAETCRPFAALAARQGRPLRVAILSDFTRIPYANGAVFQTRFLYQELRRCGHEVTVIGPHDPDATPEELAPGTVALPSVPLKTYPGLHLPMPLASWIFDPDRWDFDICFAQTTSLLLEFGVWLRRDEGHPAPLREHDAPRGGVRRPPAREALEERAACRRACT